MGTLSKYPESNEAKISIGPVYAFNPRYVRSIVIIEGGGTSWLDVNLVSGRKITSELEPLEWCHKTADAFKAANPDIKVLSIKTIPVYEDAP